MHVALESQLSVTSSHSLISSKKSWKLLKSDFCSFVVIWFVFFLGGGGGGGGGFWQTLSNSSISYNITITNYSVSTVSMVTATGEVPRNISTCGIRITVVNTNSTLINIYDI